VGSGYYRGSSFPEHSQTISPNRIHAIIVIVEKVGNENSEPTKMSSPLQLNSTPEGWSLENRLIVVTGGSKGIGHAVVEALLAHKTGQVWFCSRSPLPEGFLETLKNKYPNSGIYHVVCDVATSQGRQILVESIQSAGFQHVHGLVNNVGINVRQSIEDQTQTEYDNIMRTNIDSAYFLCKLLLPMFVSTTSIVNVSSAAGVQSSGTGIVYAMSKAAINALTRGLACELAKNNIRVNAVTPWMTMTPLLEQAVKENPSQLDKVRTWTPLHRLASPAEIANPIVFLLMPASSYITGQILGVDGGLTAQGFDGPCVTTPTGES
jgi:Tropinone reductase 1